MENHPTKCKLCGKQLRRKELKHDVGTLQHIVIYFMACPEFLLGNAPDSKEHTVFEIGQ